jgi:hypothetical protein
MKNKTTQIEISDAGTCTSLTHDGQTLTVTRAGGCPAERILSGVDFALTPEALAAAILSAWLDGYDGDAHDSGLKVQVTRGQESQEARA